MYNTYLQIMIKGTKLSIYYILYYIGVSPMAGGIQFALYFKYFWVFKLFRQFEKWVHRSQILNHIKSRCIIVYTEKKNENLFIITVCFSEKCIRWVCLR